MRIFNDLLNYVVYNEYAFVNSLKAILACCIGLLLSITLHLEQPQWMLISIVIVMASQYRLGGALKKGYARLLATSIGSGFASLILLLFAGHPIVVYCLLFIITAIFIYFANTTQENAYSFTLGAVTMVIILISNNPSPSNALERFYEILIGVVLAMLISRFVLPIHAEKVLYQNFANTMNLLNQVYRLFIREEKIFSLLETPKINLEDKILQNLAAQPVLLKEACTEAASVRKKRGKYIIFLQLERRLLRSIYMLHYTLRKSLASFDIILNMPQFKQLHKEISLKIQDLSYSIANKKEILPHRDLLQFYQEIIQPLRSVLPSYTFEEKNKIHAFLFCFEHVITILSRMEKTLLEINPKQL